MLLCRAQICSILAEAAAGRHAWAAAAAAQQLPGAPQQQQPGNPKHALSQAERRAALRSKLVKKFSAQVAMLDRPILTSLMSSSITTSS